MKAKIIDLLFEPERYNHVCGCMIPEGWTATVEWDGEILPKFIGGSPQDIVDRLKSEFGQVVGSKHIHDIVRENS